MKIADNIKPLGLDSVGFLKNFRGEVTIDLKDVKTGEVETYHDHNLVTKALGYFLKQGGLSNPSAFNASALRTDFIHYMLGGMMCLDTAITDAGGHDDEIVRVPAGVGMTANGAYNIVNTGNPPELGSWNELESGWQNDGSYKMVWDFTTSQGNGTIATVCLTSLLEGYKGIGNKSNTAKSTNIVDFGTYNSVWGKGIGTYPNVLGYNGNTVHVYNRYQGKLIETFGETVDKMIINEYAYPFTDIDVRDGIEARLLNTYEVTIPSPLHGRVGDGVIYAVMDSYCKNGIAYILVGSYYNPTTPTISSEIYVLKYNLATHAFTACIALTAEEANNNIWGISDKWVIIGKEAIQFDNPAISIDLEDASDIVTTAYDGTSGKMKALDSDNFEGVYNRDWGHILYIDTTQGKILQCNGASLTLDGCGSAPDNDLLRINNAVYRDSRYIATIFNLDSAKTKSADKTMKVTYVLRFNEEEGE